MVHGFFVENTPLIRVGVAWGQAIQTPHFILDTGFTGDLQVTPQIATELGLVPIAVENVQIANGQTVTVSACLALALMEGVVSRVQVLISNSLPLAGISFLTKFGYKAVVDCKHRIVALEKA